MQTPAPLEYERATSVDGAIASLVRLGSGARLVAGGHSLIPMMKLRLAQPEHLIDINDLDELDYIGLHPAARRESRTSSGSARSPATSRCSNRSSSTRSSRSSVRRRS